MGAQVFFHDGKVVTGVGEGTCQPIVNTAREQVKAYRRRRFFFHGILITLCFLTWWRFNTISALFAHPSWNNGDGIKEMVDFADIIPSEKLEWHPCFYNNFCARLTVPMDYNRPLNQSKDNPKVDIALVLVPGKHPIWEKHSKSPLLINPGGPGGSGTMAVLAFGHYIQKVIGEDQDIIGFDPRGVGATTPRTDCFSFPNPGSGEEDQARGMLHRTVWSLQGTENGLVNSSSDSLSKLDTRARALSKLCQDKDSLDGKDSIFKYAHTPSVARDMISIIDAWDAWAETERVGKCHPAEEIAKPSESEEDVVALDTKGKLVYWGFSYGTLLGATFAAMFPDRVGRVVLDGVVHGDHYVEPIWEDSIQDTDAIFDTFSTYCYEAKDKCDLYREGDEPEDIANRFQAVMDRIKKQPVTLAHKQSNSPIVVTHSHLKSLIFMTLYNPTALWEPVASLFDKLSEGYDEILQSLVIMPELPMFCGTSLPYWAYPNDAQFSIMCSDKRYNLNETIPNLEARFEHIANFSSFADVWMSLMVGCDSWNIEAVDPPMRWDDHPAHKQKPINTSFPVLFVSNTLDPVTPLSAGIAMARKFVDAGLIEQKSEGHCSLSAVSRCTIRKLRAYFLLGEVPSHPDASGAVDKCEADEWPFHHFQGDPFSAATEEERLEIERMMAFKQLQMAFPWSDMWGQKSEFTKLDIRLLVLRERLRLGLPA